MKAAVFTGSDLRSFGGGEKDIVGWANKIRNIHLAIFSLADESNMRMSYNDIRALLNPDIDIIYYDAIKFRFLRDIIPLTPTGVKALFSLRNYDVVYSMHQGLILNGVILLLCKLFGVRYIFGVHSPIFFDNDPIESKPLKKALMVLFVAIRNYLVRHMDNIRIQNKTDEKSIKNAGFKGTIYNIPPHVFDEQKLENISKKADEFVALFVGRLSIRHKGLDLLEEIVNLTMKRTRKIKFLIVGSGTEGESIVGKLESLYPQNFEWKGFLKEDGLLDQYKKSCIFLSTSRGENFGISLGEAQVFGLPSVAFRVMGSEDILTDEKQGILIEPFDIEAFTDAIMKYEALWESDPQGYISLRQEISNIAVKRFKDDVIVSDMANMLLSKDMGMR